MNKNLLLSLAFVLIFFGMLWLMPDIKVENIGDFIAKIVTPLAIPLSIFLGGKLGIIKYREIAKKKDEDT